MDEDKITIICPICHKGFRGDEIIELNTNEKVKKLKKSLGEIETNGWYWSVNKEIDKIFAMQDKQGGEGK